ncbi:MAG TPA: PilZ domain-containing protein [Archangium sp.]|uniref:PilZ domain-containing protein n=1 Tax=Archangium sp. TaxID=1872627 RepID=UPI002E304A52|nr:PilZ domain-containing protein [Archangium sp.]HEX5746507.1 PilZ domain-containing protein [Archangium sp.]
MSFATHALSQQSGVSAEPSRKVLLVDQAKELRLYLTPLLRAVGCEVVSVDNLLAARVELGRCRPLMVVVDWRVLPADGSPGCAALRGPARNGDVPLLVVVGDHTPAELLEACVRGGAEDCLLGPVRITELQARLDVLRERPGPLEPRMMERRTPRTVLLVGEAPDTPGGLGTDLEACGHHLLYASTHEQAVARVAECGEPLHLLLTRARVTSAEEMMRVERLRTEARLGRVPTVVVTDGDVTEMPMLGQVWLSSRTLAPRHLLSRINGQLQRNLAALLVDERVPFVCPVEYREVGTFSWSSCYSSALSPGALFVRTLVPARAGAALELRIHLPTTREVLEGPGLVAWSNPYTARRTASYPLGMGIQFLGMSPRRLMQLRELIRGNGLM